MRSRISRPLKTKPAEKWPADAVERRPVASLVPYANNARTHSDAQVAQIVASIREWGWTTPVLVDEEGGLIAGHGRVLAAKSLGLDDIPVMVARGWTAAQKRAYVLADNKLALNAGWDEGLLKIELGELKGLGFDLALTGFGEIELAGIFDVDEKALYSRKLDAPIYRQTGAKPKVSALADNAKANALRAEIDATAGLPKDVAEFLHMAADRHTVFDFHQIAEFYCHAPATVQRLFEKSALVIIDFNSAIENGFVHLTDRLTALVGADEADAA